MTDERSHGLFDYFTQPELPAPTLDTNEVEALLREHFGLEASVDNLGSQQDQNFVVHDSNSREVIGVLKVSNPAFSEAEILMQNEAAQHLSDEKTTFRVPGLVTTARGELSAWWSTSHGDVHARVIEFLPGKNFMGSDYLSPSVIARMGQIAGEASVALSNFAHPASQRTLQWDLRHAQRVIALLAAQETDETVLELVRLASATAARVLDGVEQLLPRQIGHYDITDDNLIASPGSALPDGVLDFGDVMDSWAVGELAVTVSSILHHVDITPAHVFPAIQAFDALRPLDDNEIDALWPLVILRGAVLVLSGRQQNRIDDGNAYALNGLDREYRILEQALSVPPEVMAGSIRHLLGRGSATSSRWSDGRVFPEATKVAIVDAGTLSDINNDGRWKESQALVDSAQAALSSGADLAVVPAWLPILTGAPNRTPSAPDVVPTSSTIWLGRPLEMSPDATLQASEGFLTLSTHNESLVFTAPEISAASMTLPVGVPLMVSRALPGFLSSVPAAVPAALAEGWRAVLGETLSAFADEPLGTNDVDDTLELREQVLAEVQEHYYATPPRIERGWREFLIDTHARVYLDMVNNVTSVGHAHPHVVDAATKQMKLLNTNSRFNYRVVADYADRITRLLPDELDTVFFVNSGSEAVDLSLRLAMAYTGRPDIVAMREAYHGWTYASDAVSTSIADNPNALVTRPSWVHTVDAANSYRGLHRDADAHRYAPEAVAVINRLIADNRPPAGLICESYFGNAGGVALPDGYLSEVYAAVRAGGGLAISDEVQVGYGRLGEWFWGFQQQGVVPDIVAVAKSIGGGHPLGAVITRRDIADRYRTQGYFFSSTGGSPVSSAIGMAVLDVIEQEKLQENALTVGRHLKGRLEKLADEHDIIGRVHGSGLYLGVEFVRDRTTLEPATEETEGICNRLLDLGIIMQPTGDFQNVLKIKPPLCISQESADYFVDGLERVLRTGW